MKYRIKVTRDKASHEWTAKPEKRRFLFWHWMGSYYSDVIRYRAVAGALNHIDEARAEEAIQPNKEYIYL